MVPDRPNIQVLGAQGRNGDAARVVAFEYRGCADAQWDGWAGEDDSVPVPPPRSEAELRVEFERRLTEEVRRAFEAGRERGRQEGRQTEREGAAEAEEDRRRQAVQLAAGVAQERDRYLFAVEREVVELALAVAARILRREAQMDPLLLTGAVRVALGQIASGCRVRLRVPETDLEMWTESMRLMPNLPVRPEVTTSEGMRLGDCAVECELGSVDLGIRAQLGEIERGFFDRAGPRLERTAKFAPDAAEATA